MDKEVEFFFDIVSPASYLAWTQMEKLADETGATISAQISRGRARCFSNMKLPGRVS